MIITKERLAELQNQVFSAENKVEIRGMFEELYNIAKPVKVSELAIHDSHFNTTIGNADWKNIQQNKAGYIPIRRAALAIIKHIQNSKVAE